MKRTKLAQKIKEDSEEFLKKNPEIVRALRLFDVYYDHYRGTFIQIFQRRRK